MTPDAHKGQLFLRQVSKVKGKNPASFITNTGLHFFCNFRTQHQSG